jgi:hypothetical protein
MSSHRVTKKHVFNLWACTDVVRYITAWIIQPVITSVIRYLMGRSFDGCTNKFIGPSWHFSICGSRSRHKNQYCDDYFRMDHFFIPTDGQVARRYFSSTIRRLWLTPRVRIS